MQKKHKWQIVVYPGLLVMWLLVLSGEHEKPTSSLPGGHHNIFIQTEGVVFTNMWTSCPMGYVKATLYSMQPFQGR
jgi:hypothetical protein